MARPARHRLSAERPYANALYHVTNRGVGRRDIYSTDLDRLVFLAVLAATCLDDGLRVHAFCLMSNHFHLLVEDPRGMLSRMMLRLQTAYARYANDSRGRRGSGHVFGDRFYCERVDSARYYDELASYILLNPLRCARPLAADAEAYTWSSAALTLSECDPSTFYSALVDQHGGVENILAAMPKPSRASYERTRRTRFDALQTGQWIEPRAARCGRSNVEMRQVLAARAAMRRPTPPDTQTIPTPEATHKTAARSNLLDAMVPLERFSGCVLDSTLNAIRDACKAYTLGARAAAEDLTRYTLWRFTSASQHRIAAIAKRPWAEVISSIERIRRLRHSDPAWRQLVSRLEWSLIFEIRSAPWRI